MSDGGASGGFDGGSGGGFGGGFDAGTGGGWSDPGGSAFGSGVGSTPDCAGPDSPTHPFGVGGLDGPGSASWMHQQQIHHGAPFHGLRPRGGGSLPSSPVGVVMFVLVAIVALVILANISSSAGEVYPGVPSGELVDGPVDGGFDVPTTP